MGPTNGCVTTSAVGSLLRKKEQLLAIHPDRVGRSGFTLGGPQASPSWVVRLSSDPYGKHGARRDHVAAEPRPGGNVRNARRGPGAPARVPAARALPSSLSLPGRAAPQSPTSFPRTPKAGDSSASRRAGRGDRARPFEPLEPRTPEFPKAVSRPSPDVAKPRDPRKRVQRAKYATPLSAPGTLPPPPSPKQVLGALECLDGP